MSKVDEEGPGGAAVSNGALDVLLSNVQGNAPLLEVDAGLARLSSLRLADIQDGAQQRADSCMLELRHTARMLLHALQEIPAPPEVLQPLAVAVEMLEQRVNDLARWQQLVESARRYRSQPGLAERTSVRWARAARKHGELPEP